MGQMTFAEYYKQVIELGPDVAGQRTFWINLPTPEKGVQVYTSAPPSPSADESEYQEFFTEEMQKLGAKHYCKYHVKDTSRKRSLGGRKPDLTFWPKGETLVNWNKAFLGEIKTLREEGQFTETDKGEALTWAHRLLQMHPQRRSAMSFLTDTRHIMFFRVRREPHGQVTYSWTAVVPLYKTKKEAKRQGQKLREIRKAASGFNWLKSLLATDPRDEGVGLVDIPQPRFSRDISMSDFLGGGATSQVYRASNGMVVKLLADRFADLCENEKHILQQLSKNEAIQKYIPKVVEAANNALLMEPEGLPLTHPTLAHWNQVLLILKELHAGGYVHRDIRPNNILIQAGTQDVLLIDFGFSVDAAKLVPYCGTVHYASNSILEALSQEHQEIQCTPADDLVSLVHSAFSLHFPAFRSKLEKIAHYERQQIRRFWDETLKNIPHWKACLQAAEQAHYDALAKLLSQFLY